MGKYLFKLNGFTVQRKRSLILFSCFSHHIFYAKVSLLVALHMLTKSEKYKTKNYPPKKGEISLICLMLCLVHGINKINGSNVLGRSLNVTALNKFAIDFHGIILFIAAH